MFPKIDHVTIAGANLKGMSEAFTRATGIPVEYGGPHDNRATEMALTSFPDGSYLEFIAIQPGADEQAVAAHTWSPFLRERSEPCAFAVRVGNMAETMQQMNRRGIRLSEPDRRGRTRPDGAGVLWETVNLGPGPRGSFFPFLIQDLTPRETRVLPNDRITSDEFSGISRVVIGTADFDKAIERYRRAFDLAAPRIETDRDFEAKLAAFNDAPVVLAQALDADSWLERRVSTFGEAPCAFVLPTEKQPARGKRSDWFGNKVYWADQNEVGWRFGIETVTPTP